MRVRQMRGEQAAARTCDLRRDHRQQPHRGHAVERMFVPSKHEVGDRYTAGERHRDVDPPQCLGDRDHASAEPRQAERQEPVDDRRQPHRDRADEHRHGVVPEDPPRLVSEHRPARGVEPGEQREERDVEVPQRLADRVQRCADARHLRQGERENAGAHRSGEPVGGELPDHLARGVEPAEGLQAIENGFQIGGHLPVSLMRSVSASAARVRYRSLWRSA